MHAPLMMMTRTTLAEFLTSVLVQCFAFSNRLISFSTNVRVSWLFDVALLGEWGFISAMEGLIVWVSLRLMSSV